MHHCAIYHAETADAVGRTRRKMLADCFEAYLGALFLDKQPYGFAAVKTFTNSMLFTLTEQTLHERRWMDPKTRLRYVLAEFNKNNGHRPGFALLTATFGTIEEYGPGHERMFIVGCYINGELIA